MKKILRYMMVFMLMSSAACNSWLDVVPEDDRVSEEYWTTKEDVENTTIAGYVNLRACLLQMIQWGELRANSLDLGEKSIDFEQNIRELNITSENDIVKWNKFYKVINTANSVLKNAELVTLKDPTFTKEEYEASIAENMFIRSFCYFYLVRSFGEVPLVLEPYLTDDQSYQQPKVSERIIIDTLIQNLEAALPASRLEFSTDKADEWQDRARGTRWAMLALLADIYLWDGQYEKADFSCERLMQSGRFGLVGQEDWFTNYYPGNSVEIIFQLHFDQELDQKNEMYNWFSNSLRYVISEELVNEFTLESEDVRGLGGTFFEEDEFKIWKYIGQEAIELGGKINKRAAKDRSPHWICYRYADILLMKAEALVMKAGESNSTYIDAMSLVNRVRTRAGAKLLTEEEVVGLPQEEFLKLILNERKKEFVSEGKHWFDILRIGRRDDYKYKDMMIEILLENVSIDNRPIYETKLSDKNAYFFPIHYDEIQSSGGVLTQNPYYLK